MITKGDGIVIGLSGGPDSTALIHILNSLKDVLEIKLYAVHINHMIRGEEAFRDEEYSKTLAQSMGIPFFCKRIKIEDFARENKMSSEEAGRYVRYQFFDEVLNKMGAGKIALAHNLNDQVETMLMRFFRGSGISGIAGIRPVRDGKYIRPLLNCSRDEIERYCSENKLNPVIDSTNKECIYTRNKIRLELVPYIRENFNPRFEENMFKMADLAKDEDEYLNIKALEELEGIKIKDGVLIDNFNELHIALKRRILRTLIELIKGNLNGIEVKHIEECIELISQKNTGKSISLPDDIECVIQYDIFKIRKKTDYSQFQYEIIINGETKIPELGMSLITKLIDSSEMVRESFNVKYFDYDKIDGGLMVRNRRDGDYIYPKGMNGRKKIKDIFIDKKIPKEDREKLPLIALGSEILWIYGIRDTKNYKVDGNTKRILEIKFERGVNYAEC
ncbi:tRNA(Ile)-lysidine synthetase [Fervidicella metallireducens AeB]|uniref:tRNA(Ile)-lysidine synthase n=1 Tax=Fervidicella metallireducens AeB TaxID=1403537 RepID=A0A017RTJ0_9CLOT|nr:tRNA lysidine(34) synthetase TilS [Fervidicella metallireducens]EYE87926.1 tRNA(Ile)-lysidine synthetase [Fervidicella metallireducens AeB]